MEHSNAFIKNTSFNNGYSTGVSAGIFINNASLIINDSVFSNSFSGWGGNAIGTWNYAANMSINNCTFKNLSMVKTVDIPITVAVIQSHIGSLNLTNCNFVNITSYSRNIGAVQFTGSNINIINNTFENITCNETIMLYPSSENITNENNTFKNSSIGYNYTIQTDNTTVYKVGDTVEFNITINNITHPYSYISKYPSGTPESENKFQEDSDNFINRQKTELTYDIYLNDKYLYTTTPGEESFTITSDISEMSTVYVINSYDKKSNNVSFESELNGLNTFFTISYEELFDDNATYIITVTDTNNNLIDDCGSISIYENNTFINESSTINGVAIITTDKLSSGYHTLTFHYNDSTSKYNNHTENIISFVGAKKIYVAPNVGEAQLGTIDTPTTINDALSRIGNNGTVYFLPGVYELNETILLAWKTHGYMSTGGLPLENAFLHDSVKSVQFEGVDDVTLTGTILNSTNNLISVITDKTGKSVDFSISNFKFINVLTAMTLNIISSSAQVNNCTFQNISIGINKQVTSSNLVQINNCRFENYETAIHDDGGNITVTNTVFFNENKIKKSKAIDMWYLATSSYVTSINNTYINHYATKEGGAITTMNLISINDTFINNTGLDGGSIYLKSTVEGEMSYLIVYNSKFINSTATSEGGAIYGLVKNVQIINSTFENVKSKSETIYLPMVNNKTMKNNTYNNCDILFNEFSLNSTQNNQIINTNDNIILSMNISLKTPKYYDNNILEKMIMPIIINNQHKYNITNTLTIPAEYDTQTAGLLNIYANMGDKQSNNITIQVEEIKKAIVVEQVTTTIGESINITATIYYGENILTNINKGKVTFKVDGKTLKDANGKVIYAKVVNGTATIENYTVPDNWNNSTTIQAVYSGSTECEKLTTEKTNITILADEPTLTIEDMTATAGDKITLKATITDNDKVINTGKIVFKINGKTVKDENGKVIYAKVVNNTVEFEYTLPESMKAGMYNITATFISADYDRLTDSKTLTVN